MRYRACLNALLCGVALLPVLGHAGCSRVISVPLSATGLGVMVDGGSVTGGVYPDVLRSIQARGDCSFALSVVPRARLEAMFKNGSADLLIPATRSPQRELSGLFVPLVRNRATLISVRSDRAPITSVQELLDNASIKVVLVRGFTYGAVYDELARKLEGLGRLQYEADPASVARRLQDQSGLVTLMAPSILVGEIRTQRRLQRLLGNLRFETLEELPWGESGAYVSRRSLNEADTRTLIGLLENAAKSGLVWKEFRRYYSDDLRLEGIAPR